MKLIDLTHKIEDKMSVYPGDTKTTLTQCAFLNKDYYNNFELKTGMHAGTHIDSSGHLTNDKRKIYDFDLSKFIGPAVAVDVSSKLIIDYEDRFSSIINKNDIVLFYTGQSKKWNTEEYYKNAPVFTEKLADFLIQQKIKILGIDSPSPDKFPFPIHHKLFSTNILIIENLTNLEKLINKRFELIAFPLKIESDSSILRVIARLN